MTAKHSISYGVLDTLRSIPFFLTAPLCRPWHLRWGATDAEVDGLMPGGLCMRLRAGQVVPASTRHPEGKPRAVRQRTASQAHFGIRIGSAEDLLSCTRQD